VGNLGVQSFGLRQLRDRWLISWNGEADLVLGGVAYEYPFHWLYGASGTAHGEGGWRILPAHSISPYLGAGLDAALSAVTEPGVAFDAGTMINDLDGLGGVIGTGDVRLALGVSFLGPRQSLLIEAQPLAEIDSAQSNLPFLDYLGGALHARYDRRDSLVAIGEASYAVTPAQQDAALGTSSTSSRWSLSGSVVKKLAHHWFVGGGLSVSRTATQLDYASGLDYATDTPVEARFSLLAGYWP
ncbi:MAG TPA: hypothetical protein VMB50_14390, partial [Myxococcales bacterium]|nr:hypothetical protein [Myxococcales bacterium]